MSQIACDGCGRGPRFVEWMKGEIFGGGYGNWRHPGLIFKESGCPFDGENVARAERVFEALFNRPVPEESAFLCPECQEKAAMRIPDLVASDTGPAERQRPDGYRW